MEKRSFYLQLVCIIILLSFLFFSSESADHVTANHYKTPKFKEKSTMQQKYLGESKTTAPGSGSIHSGPGTGGRR
uniref:Transmembrane protein n=1 Tax=Manihot esculenta TaxID=3983 RepID=A0A2C9U859_MANES